MCSNFGKKGKEKEKKFLVIPPVGTPCFFKKKQKRVCFTSLVLNRMAPISMLSFRGRHDVNKRDSVLGISIKSISY